MNSSGRFLLAIAEHSDEPMQRQIARELRDQILTRDLAAGTRMPPVRRLARRVRASASCVLGAYEILENRGFVCRKDGIWFVASTVRQHEARQQKWSRTHIPSSAELETASEVQGRLLPPRMVVGEGFRVISRHEAAGFVAGDFHDVSREHDGNVGIVVADVAGKGIGSALIMAWVKGLIDSLSRDRDVECTLRELNRRLTSILDSREFVALSYARFNPESRKLRIASGGLPDPYLINGRRAHRALQIPGPRLPLGVRGDVAYQALEVTLNPGERLLMLSDGIPEALNHRGEPLGYERLSQLLARNPESSVDGDPESWLDNLLDSVRSETSPDPDDDWTAVVLESRTRKMDR